MTTMQKNAVSKVETFLRSYFAKEKLPIQAFNTRNIAGDYMQNIYMCPSYNLIIDYCSGYNYIEIFGLGEEQFEMLKAKGVIF